MILERPWHGGWEQRLPWLFPVRLASWYSWSLMRRAIAPRLHPANQGVPLGVTIWMPPVAPSW